MTRQLAILPVVQRRSIVAATVVGLMLLCVNAHAQAPNEASSRKASTRSKPKDFSGKVVIANVDKHRFGYRIGKVQKEVSPKKATVFTPKKYPVQFEIWSGNQKLQWQPVSVSEPGLYIAQFEKGRWAVTKRTPRTKADQAATPSRSTARSAPRNVGSRSRVAQRGGGTRVVVNPRRFGRPWRGYYWSPVARCVWAYATLYPYIEDIIVRDEIRDWIIGGEIDDAIREEIEDAIWDNIDGAVNLPAEELDDLRRAWDELRDLNAEDWREAVNLPADEWDHIRDELGDELNDDQWGGLQDDFEQIHDTMDLTDADVDTMDEVGLDDLQQDIDLDEIDGADMGDVGELDLDDVNPAMDLDDVTMDAETLDIGDLSDIGGDDFDLGHDFAAPDFAVPGAGAGNLELGGGIDNGLGDINAGNLGGGLGMGGGMGGGMGMGGASGNVDGGGWDSYDYGNYGWGGGNDWGGGGFGGGGFDGGFGGGDFGGGDFGGGGLGGGDFGGGDFGGGDFGGGFDDFGGGFDF